MPAEQCMDSMLVTCLISTFKHICYLQEGKQNRMKTMQCISIKRQVSDWEKKISKVNGTCLSTSLVDILLNDLYLPVP